MKFIKIGICVKIASHIPLTIARHIPLTFAYPTGLYL